MYLPTENEICSSPITISSSCFPTRSGSGHWWSSSLQYVKYVIHNIHEYRNVYISLVFNTHFITSLSWMILLSSFNTPSLTWTKTDVSTYYILYNLYGIIVLAVTWFTFFSNHGFVFVVWVVCISQFSIRSEFKL